MPKRDRFVRLTVDVLFVGGPHDGRRMMLPGDEHGRPRPHRFRLPIEPPTPSLCDFDGYLNDAEMLPLAAEYEPDLAVSDHDHLWRFRYTGQR